MTDLIEQIWRSTANQAAPAESRDAALSLAAEFARRDAERRRRLWVTGIMLGLFSLATGAAMFDQAGRGAAVSGLALLALSWAMWGLLAVQGRPDLVARSESLPLLEVLNAMQRRNRRQRRGAVQMSGVVLLTIAPLWLAVGQLQAAGQASAREASQMGALLTLALIGGASFLLIRSLAGLAPERRRLDRLIADHAAP